MKLGHHAAVSVAIGVGLWAATGDARTLPAAVAAGVLPDVDHLLDYYNWYIRRDTRRLILIFHGWEYLVAAVLIYVFAFTEPWMLAVVLGYASQVGTDQIFNGVRWHTYSLLARASLGFDARRVVGRDMTQAYEALVDSLPVFRDPVRRWFERRIEGPSIGEKKLTGR